MYVPDPPAAVPPVKVVDVLVQIEVAVPLVFPVITGFTVTVAVALFTAAQEPLVITAL